MMNNLDAIVNKIEKHIDDKERKRETAIRNSRTIIICSRKSIQHMHQGHFGEAEELLARSSTIIKELYEAIKLYPDLGTAGFVDNAAQEFVEAQCFFNILQGKNLPDPDEIQITYTSYLEGLCDVIGELRRKVLDTLINGEFKDAHQYLIIMEDIYDAIIRFDYPSSLVPIKRKQDIARNLIEKTRGELSVASCEQRLECRAEEFRKIFNERSKEKAPCIDQKNQELDIDRVW